MIILSIMMKFINELVFVYGSYYVIFMIPNLPIIILIFNYFDYLGTTPFIIVLLHVQYFEL